MPKAKKYSSKIYRRRNNKTKRGGMENNTPKSHTQFYPFNPTTGEIGEIRKAKFIDTTKMPINSDSNISTKHLFDRATVEEVEAVFAGPNPEEKKQMERQKAEEEFKGLMKKWETDFPKKTEQGQEEECIDGMCVISGGRKSRKYRKKTHKNFKSRKSRKSRKY